MSVGGGGGVHGRTDGRSVGDVEGEEMRNFLAEEEGILIGSSMHITTVRFIAFVVKS
jgi:hypothetical protein